MIGIRTKAGARALGRATASALVALAASISTVLAAVAQDAQSDAAQETTAPVADEKRPNILVVLFDDVGFMGFGAYGADARTPTIDKIAGKGAMLSRYYSSPFCGPSRAMLMTGMDNHQVGMGTLVETATDEMRAFPGYSMRWRASQETIGTLLSGAGYRTYVTGKWGIGETGANLPDKFGFDRSYVMDATGGSNYDAKPYLPGYDKVDWFEDGDPIELPDDFYSSRSLVDKMIDYVDSGDPDQPFFGFLSLQAVHIPLQAPVSFIDRYDGVFDDGWDVMRKERLRRAIDLGLVPPTTKLAPAPETHRAWNDLTTDEKAISTREMQVNAGMMEAADYHIGRLLDHLEATGQLENTIVIITSDNGAESAMTEFEGVANVALDAVKWLEGFDTSPENFGQPRSLTAMGPEWASVTAAPFDLYKFYGSEGGLRVPLVVAGPGVAASGIVDAPVHVADLVPTLLDAAGVPYDPEMFFGRSAMPLLAGASETTYGDNDSFGLEVSGNAALYRGTWKITRLAPPLGDSIWRLYDLSIDPGETTDLSAEYPEVFSSMLAEYGIYSETVGVFELGPDDSAFKVLENKLITKALHKYWPHIAALVLVVMLVLVGSAFVGGQVIRSVSGRQHR
ncbi:MAG: arylsulfatase [Pseudomonadota bacterium]